MKPVLCALGYYTILWGLWIGNPFWEVYPHAEVYSAMADFLPEWAWGFNAAICGGSLLYGAWRPSPGAMTWGILVGVYHWTLVGALFAFGDWRNTGAISAAAIAVLLLLVGRYNKRHPQGWPNQ